MNKHVTILALGVLGAVATLASAHSASVPTSSSSRATSTYSQLTATDGTLHGQAAMNFGEQVASQKIKELIPSLGKDAPEWLKRFEVNLNFLDTGKPEQSILTVQPLYQSDNKQDTVFVQGSLYHYALFGDYRWTGNIGTGYRRLLANNTVMLGANAFFDNEFSYDHRRTSVGAEAKWGPLDFGFNNYFGLSGDKSVGGDLERALSGRDFTLTTQMPYVPWIKVGGSHFRWDAHKATDDTTGETFSASFALHPNFGVEYKWSSYDLNNNNSQSQNTVMLRFQLADLSKPSLTSSPIIAKKVFETRDLTHETLTKVVRENRIIVERRTTGGVIIRRGN